MQIGKGIYKRGGVFWVRFTPHPGAAQMRRSLETSDEVKALAKAREVRSEESESARLEAVSCHTAIQDYMSYAASKARTRATLKVRRSTLTRFVRDMGVATPAEITKRKIEKWLVDQKDLKPSSKQQYLRTLHLWLQWLQDERRIPSNPSVEVSTPPVPKGGRRKFLLPDQARKLLDTAEDKDLKFAVYCGLHAGLRLNEVIEARPEWFDLENKLIHVQATSTFTPKDKDNRTIPMTAELHQWLSNDFGLRSPFMFRPDVKHGAGLYRCTFGVSYKTLIKRAGLSATFHDLRRTFASLLVSKGVSIYKVAKWLGDGVVIVEETYGHLVPQDDDINKSWEKPEVKKPA